MSETRIVITGTGCITPIGTGREAFWKAALAGTNGVKPITSFDTTDFRTKVGGEVKDFTCADWIDESQCSAMGLSSRYAVAAVAMAMEQSGLDRTAPDPYRTAVSMGTTMGEPQVLEEGIRSLYPEKKAANIPADLPAKYPCGVIPANVARYVGAKGPVSIIPTACAAGNYALGYGFDLIKLGQADVVITGGSDPFSRIAFTGFTRLLATAEEACRPFSKNRDGMVVAEGAGALVLESLDNAQKRGAPILAEVLGYGLGCDAFKMTIPDPTGSGGIRALKRAIENARISPDEIDYICAHGTGTGENDKTETLISKEVLGDRAKDVPISSLKSMLGHTMGAASAIEAVACVMMLQHQVMLPTINYDEPDPECDLDYVPNKPREKALRTVVSNAYAFGGNTSSIVLRSFSS